ncbi:MAG TPA: zinc-binding dehydrogenase, partial [Terriglobia bacterium]|nr:zinc-binding dehydrogenase [Terriglobia bacterium]
AGPIGLSVIEFARLRGLAAAVMDINEKRLAYCRDTLKIAHCLNGAGDPPAQLRALYKGELPTVVMDCTGNPQSMMNAFHYLAPGGKLIFVGLFSGEVTFDDPSFHRNEMTLMSSRNSTGDDFRRVLRLMESGVIDVDRWITHRIPYTGVASELPAWIQSGVEFRKAIVEW